MNVNMTDKFSITIDSKYLRRQLDDYLASGEVNYKGRTYYWSAEDSNYGFGWEIEPVSEEDWEDIGEDECTEIMSVIEKYLSVHETEYRLV